MKCKDFMEFCYQLGSLGDLREKNILIRDQEEDLEQPSNEQLLSLVEQVERRREGILL